MCCKWYSKQVDFAPWITMANQWINFPTDCCLCDHNIRPFVVIMLYFFVPLCFWYMNINDSFWVWNAKKEHFMIWIFFLSMLINISTTDLHRSPKQSFFFINIFHYLQKKKSKQVIFMSTSWEWTIRTSQFAITLHNLISIKSQNKLSSLSASWEWEGRKRPTQERFMLLSPLWSLF